MGIKIFKKGEMLMKNEQDKIVECKNKVDEAYKNLKEAEKEYQKSSFKEIFKNLQDDEWIEIRTRGRGVSFSKKDLHICFN